MELKDMEVDTRLVSGGEAVKMVKMVKMVLR